MFASRAITSTQAGHRCATSAKFTHSTHIDPENNDLPRISEIEEIAHPKRGLACACVSSLFCPVLGFLAVVYAVRAVRAFNKGYFAEATIFYKKSIRWSLLTFIFGLIIGSIILFVFFVKTVLFI